MVAVSGPGAGHPAQLDAVRRALRVAPHVPMTHCDPRLRESGRKVLITLIEYVRAVVDHRTAIVTV